MAERYYPSGIYSGQEPQDPDLDQNPGDDPSWVDGVVLEMSEQWTPIDFCVGGTQYLRENSRLFIPIEPAEDEDAYERRIAHATLSPFTVRIAEQAAGLILRKPIQLVGKEEDTEPDPYWEEFASNVDGYGTTLDDFARRVAISSVLYGHAGILVDYPSTEAAPNLAAERAMGLRPYFINVDAKQILGWRKEEGSPIAPISQIRINEVVSEPLGEFGSELVRQIRVLEPGRYRVYRRGRSESQTWTIVSEGTTSLGGIPLAVTYSGKVAELVSKPPLLAIANLNISHASSTCDLNHSLHVSAMPILTLAGYDDSGNQIALSANSAILLPPDGSASYVEPASSSFEAQQNFITQLESQMSNLGISTLFAQKNSAETAESKQLSRTDSDSLLAIVSKDLEATVQSALDMAAEYVGIEAPKVMIDRDFDLQVLDSGQVQQYLSLWTNGAISQELLLEMLKRGEVLPEIDVEAEVEKTQQEKVGGVMNSMLPMVAGAATREVREENEDEDDSEASPSDIRRLVEERLRGLAGGQNEVEAEE